MSIDPRLASLAHQTVGAFSYLICLDFEATCWKEEERDFNAAEIIEIGAVLLNMKNGEIESEFHEYVGPTQRPILSEYCVNLTGITQDLISRQQTFPMAYQRFNAWLEWIQNIKQVKFAKPPPVRSPLYPDRSNATFCTWTNYDLNHFFHLDCKRHGIDPPYHFKAWIDARKIFEGRARIRMPFSDALKYLGIIETGNAHSAIDDARNLTKLVNHLRLFLYVPFSNVTTWTEY